MVSSRVKAIFGVTGVVFLSKIIGLLREIVIAGKFGTSPEYDLYLVALILPALAYGVINFASFYLFVPYLTRKFEKLESENKTGDWHTVWPLMNFSLVIALGVMAVIVILAPYLMRIWTAEYNAAQFTEVVFYSRVTAVIIVLGTSEAYLRALLNVKKIFTYPSAGPIIFNLFSILCILIFAGKFSVGAIALGLVVGLLLQNLYLWLRITKIIPPGGFSFGFYNHEIKAILSTAGVLFFIELLNRSYFMIDRYFAPKFGEGIIAALNYSQVMVQLPDAVVGFAIASVLFPLFSQSYEKGGFEKFGRLYRQAITGGMLVAVPLAVLFFVNAREIVYLLFFRGAFDSKSLTFTVNVLRPYVPTIIALFIVSTSIRACYGRGWGRTVLVFTVLLLAVKYVGTAVFSKFWDYPGISAATTVSQVGFALSLLVIILSRAEIPDRSKFIGVLLKVLAAGAVSFVGLYYFNHWLVLEVADLTFMTALKQLVLSALVLAVIYLLLIYLWGLGNQVKEVLRLGTERK